MSAAELIHRATVAGVEMTVERDGRLLLRADHPPSADLLAELVAYKVEIIAALSAANSPMPSSAWLARIARLLGIRSAELLERGHLEPHDLTELVGTDAALVADTIRASPAWINRPQRIEMPVKACGEEEEAKGERPVHTAATASADWLTARDQFYQHLSNCRACHAPAGRYCPSGSDLRQHYNDTSQEANPQKRRTNYWR